MDHLTLVGDSPDIEPVRTSGVLRARPADRCEPWTPHRTSEVGPIAVAAAAAGLDTNLAAVLIVERRLIEVEFGLARRDLDLPRLDDAAAAAQVEMELSAASADYLRALRPRVGASSPAPASFRLPMRLGDRILRVGLERLLRPQVLESAVSWERASMLAGQTMSEWVLVSEG